MPTDMRVVRYRQRVQESLRMALAAFLADLPPDGWTGNSAELLEWLEAYKGERDPLPPRNLVVREVEAARAVLDDHGFQLVHRRSHTTRYLSIERRGKK